MQLNIKKKVAIVTGASRGMGKAIAFALSREGVYVCMVARNFKDLKKLTKEIYCETGAEVICFPGDVSDPTLPDKVIKGVVKKWGAVHILVNNAGGPPSGSFLEFSDVDWTSTLDQTLMSVIRFSRTVAPFMKQQNWGRIINIVSTAAKEPTPNMVLSATARAGVLAFSKAIATELAPYQITVNSLSPGGVLTDRLFDLFKEIAQKQNVSYEELLERTKASIPMNRFASPEEIASIVLLLASSQSSYITGTNIAVDGGISKSIF